MDNTNRKSEKDIFPQTYIVVEFGCDIKTETAQWLVDKISKKRKDGGAELLVRRQPATFGQVNFSIFLSITVKLGYSLLSFSFPVLFQLSRILQYMCLRI